jgi:hypothetical protein
MAVAACSRNNMGAHRTDAAVLADLGVRIDADQLNHAKGVIADDAHGALFSANFDAAHGLLDGVEAGVRLDGQPALAEAGRFFRHAMEHADLEYARSGAWSCCGSERQTVTDPGSQRGQCRWTRHPWRYIWQ